MGASLMQQCRVQDEAFRGVNCFGVGGERTVPHKKVTANYVPAAAVIRRWRTLSGITGRKGSVGGFVGLT